MANSPSNPTQTFTDKQMMLCIAAGCAFRKEVTAGVIAIITLNPVRINEDDKQIEIIEEIEGIERRIVFPKA